MQTPHPQQRTTARYGSRPWRVGADPSLSARLLDVPEPSLFQRIPWEAKLLLAVEVVILGSGIVYFWRTVTPAQPILILALIFQVLFAFVVLIRSYFIGDRRVRPFCAVVLLTLPLVVFIAGRLGRILPGGYSLVNIAAMRNVVFEMERGALPFENGKTFILPKKYRTSSYMVSANRDGNNALTVTFYERRDFPPYRVVYLYRSDDRLTPDINQQWAKRTPLLPHWYAVSD